MGFTNQNRDLASNALWEQAATVVNTTGTRGGRSAGAGYYRGSVVNKASTPMLRGARTRAYTRQRDTSPASVEKTGSGSAVSDDCPRRTRAAARSLRQRASGGEVHRDIGGTTTTTTAFTSRSLRVWASTR